MDNLIRVLISFFCLLLISACGKNLPVNLSEKPNSAALLGTTVSGNILDSENQPISLQNITKPLVLVFAQETCLVCIGEAQHFREHLTNPAVEPTNVKLLTVVVGADVQIAKEWKDLWQIPWTVAYDENLQLFPKYCAEKLTPCTIVSTPTSGIVFTKMGPVVPSEIEPFTGPWN